MAKAQRQFCGFAFVQEGYWKWMDHAAFEKKCTEVYTLLKLLISGLRKIGRLRTLKLRVELLFHVGFSCEGSPLARSWHPLHARLGGWTSGPYQTLNRSSASNGFWTPAFALSGAGKTGFRNLSVECALHYSTFLTKAVGKQIRMGCVVAASAEPKN